MIIIKRLSQFILISFISVFLMGNDGCEEMDPDSSKLAVADEMIAAFSNGCRKGVWTEVALSRSQSLTAVLKSLKDKTMCKGIADVLDSATHLEGELTKMADDRSLLDERKWEETVKDLEIALEGNNLDPLVKEVLLSNYSFARYELSQARGEVNAAEKPSSIYRSTEATARLRRHINTLVSKTDVLADCYADNPTAGLQIATSLGGIASSFAPSTVGLGLQAISSLISGGVQLARTLPISKAIYETRKNRMPLALKCGMETMTRDYCRAGDARKFSKLRKKINGEPEPFFYGVDLMEKRLPILNVWLDKLVNGSDPVDSDQARRIDEQYKRLNAANSMSRLAKGAISEARADIDRSTSNLENITIIKRVVRNLVLEVFFYQTCGSGTSCSRPYSPFEDDIFTVTKKITGTTLEQGTMDILTYISTIPYQPNHLSIIEDNLFNHETGIFTNAYRLVVKKFNEEVNVDNGTLVKEATSNRTNNVSVFGTLIRIKKFLRSYKYHQNINVKAQEKELIEDLLFKVDSVLADLRRPDATNDKRASKDVLSPAQQVISNVYDLFDLGENNVVLPRRMDRLITDDLTNRMCQGDGPEDVKEILRLAGQDMMDFLLEANLTPREIETDVSQSQTMSRSTLKTFRDKFEEPIGWVVDDLYEALQRDGLGLDSSLGDSLAHICIFTLISGMDWPKDVDRKKCKGTFIKSEEAEIILEFNDLEKEIKNKNFDERVCIYEDFMRSDRLSFVLTNRDGTPDICELPEQIGKIKLRHFFK